jgi:hypothetical protein
MTVAPEHGSLKVTESFLGARPATDSSALVRRLLATVPDMYLVGLDSVLICNLSEQSRKIRTGTLPRRGRRISRGEVAGLYHRSWNGQKAWIQVFADQIPQLPWYVRWIRPLSDLHFGSVLYHELGHHVHTINPEHREREDIADQWSARFSVQHFRRVYWYLYPVAWTAAKIRNGYIRLSKKKQ